MLDVCSDFIQEEKALNELAEKIEFNANNQIGDPDLIQSYGARLQKFEESGGYRYESEIKGVLAGLNFTEDFYDAQRSEEHTSELQSRGHLVCCILLEKTN